MGGQCQREVGFGIFGFGAGRGDGSLGWRRWSIPRAQAG